MSVLRAAWFLIGTGARGGRLRMARAVALMLAGYIAAPLAALALGHLADDLLGHRHGAPFWLIALTAVLLVGQLMLSHFAHLDYFELAEAQESALRRELIDLVNGPPQITHLDKPVFADNLALAREALSGNVRSLEAVLQLTGLIVQTAITATILVRLSPWLALLPLTALPPVVFSRKAQTLLERARERAAGQVRLSTHLTELATSATSVKELRIFGAERELLSRQDAALAVITRTMGHAQAAAAALRAAGQLVFALGYGGAILLLARSAMAGHATIGDVVVVITLAVQVSTQIAGALQLLAVLQEAGQTALRIQAMRAMARPSQTGPRPVRHGQPPGRLQCGITLNHVSFAYPGSRDPVLRDVCLDIGAGQTLALLGDNGSGKSTLVKLLCGMYPPDSGQILADGADLTAIDPAAWRSKVATLFQDFYRFQFTLGESIGIGEVGLLGDDTAVMQAMRQAGAQSVLEAVPSGLASLIGRAYGDGTELSGGQWQLTGLARCLMRSRPLLLILDEPAAALDAPTEDALFERYASAASAARELGSITVLISHRLSTVRMADTIAVLADGRITEHGTHADLMAGGGRYAELFELQARGYR